MALLDYLDYTFFQNALWAALLSSLLCGFVGTYIVTRRLVFVGGGISHASLGGVGIGAYFGFSPLLGALGFGLLSAVGIRVLSQSNNMREDSAIAMLWTLGMGVGILCAGLSPGFMPELPSFLFGNILLVNKASLMFQGGLLLAVALFFVCFFKPIVATAFDADFAKTQGLNIGLIDGVMLVIIAATIVSCLNVMGIVLVISLLSIPQSTANLLTHRFEWMIALSALLALISCLGGLLLSLAYNVPSGAAIIVVSIALYFVCYGIVRLKRQLLPTP